MKKKYLFALALIAIFLTAFSAYKSQKDGYDFGAMVGNFNNNTHQKQIVLQNFKGTSEENHNFDSAHKISIEFSRIKGNFEFELKDPDNKSLFKKVINKDSKNCNIDGFFPEGKYKIVYTSENLENATINLLFE